MSDSKTTFATLAAGRRECARCGHGKGQYHELKIWTHHFVEVQSGKKAFELRKDDRGFQVGDLLCLQEYDPETHHYSGRSVYRYVVSILSKFPGLEEGYVIMGLVPA